MMRNIILIVALIVVAVGVSFSMFGGNGINAAPAATGETANVPAWEFDAGKYEDFQPVVQPSGLREFVSVHETDVIVGDPDAPVTIIEFFSYACVHCRQFHTRNYPAIKAAYIDTGKVRYIKRDFILTTDGAGRPIAGFELYAGSGSQCFVDQPQRDRFADTVFAQQDQLRAAADPVGALLPIFENAGLDEATARACMIDDRNRTLVWGRYASAASRDWVTGTPTFYINGERHMGGYGTDELTLSIERALRN